VRHLVLPADVAGTGKVLAFIAEEISRNTYVNIMAQYRPCYRAFDDPPLDRPITRVEHEAALALAARHGLTRLDRRTS
jgi:putative pyruvate formate lyase activating enzyme